MTKKQYLPRKPGFLFLIFLFIVFTIVPATSAMKLETAKPEEAGMSSERIVESGTIHKKLRSSKTVFNFYLYS